MRSNTALQDVRKIIGVSEDKGGKEESKIHNLKKMVESKCKKQKLGMNNKNLKT